MSAALQAELNRELQAEHGISLADYEVLGRLHDAADTRLRTLDLVATLTWEQSRVSHQLTRMQRRGLVYGRPVSPTDAARCTHSPTSAAAPSNRPPPTTSPQSAA